MAKSLKWCIHFHPRLPCCKSPEKGISVSAQDYSCLRSLVAMLRSLCECSWAYSQHFCIIRSRTWTEHMCKILLWLHQIGVKHLLPRVYRICDWQHRATQFSALHRNLSVQLGFVTQLQTCRKISENLEKKLLMHLYDPKVCTVVKKKKTINWRILSWVLKCHQLAVCDFN